MINEERLRPMVKMAMFDKNEGKACKPMIQYARTDYISMQLLRSFISGSIAFAILCVMWALYDTEAMMGMLNAAYIMEFITAVALRYVLFMFVYLTATYVVYQIRYTHRRKMVKTYYKNLQDINKIYEREDKLKAPSKDDWK
ncbi:MAG: hypothetical protein IJZ23_09280 [Roseburia sp.]|nr:hypothetical protein [Roseburia sp.]